MRFIFLLHLFLLAGHLPAQTNEWQKTSFPDSNYVYCIFNLEDKTFAGSFQGLFISEDKGESWQNLTLNYTIGSVNDLLYVDGIYYLSSWATGVWMSSNLSTWEPVSDGLPKYVTALEYFDGRLFAATSNSVFWLNPSTKSWKSDSLKLSISHNDYILDLAKQGNTVLYAAGCDYLYQKTNGVWQVMDTSYQFCGVGIRDDADNIFVNTTGSGIQKYGLTGSGITETILPNPQEPSSWSVADFAFFDGEMMIISQHSIYYKAQDTSEVVCGDLLTTLTIDSNNIFVGTQGAGIWKKGALFLKQNGIDRNVASSKAPNIQFDLLPTPSEGQILAKIRMDEGQTGLFSVFDATGKMILNKKINNSLDLEFHLAFPGLYMSMFTSGKMKVTKRIIIQ
jgi:hypothetical protein